MKLPMAWVVWLAAMLVVLSTTRNPLYLVVTLLCIAFVSLTLGRGANSYSRSFSPWKFAGWIILLATAFNALTSHHGETGLFTIPGKIPLISGIVTLEAIVYGATNGLILTGMLVSFTVLNQALPIRDMISLIPRAFFPVAVVTSIAVTYLPTTTRQFQQIREAQAVRGHQMRSVREWLPLLMPLLIGGLEHALQLAEAMTARGFASGRSEVGGRQVQARLLMLLGVVMLGFGGWIKLSTTSWAGWLVLASGAGLILIGLWLVGSRSSRTAYHPHAPTWQDGICLLWALAVIVMYLIPLPRIGGETLYYDPYPLLRLPSFSPLIGIMTLGLLLPGLFALKSLK